MGHIDVNAFQKTWGTVRHACILSRSQRSAKFSFLEKSAMVYLLPGKHQLNVLSLRAGTPAQTSMAPI